MGHMGPMGPICPIREHLILNFSLSGTMTVARRPPPPARLRLHVRRLAVANLRTAATRPYRRRERDQLCRWLQAAMGVLHGVAGSREFFPRAARAVVDLVGLDSGRVRLLDGTSWVVQAAEHANGPPSNPDWRPSRQVLARLVADKR